MKIEKYFVGYLWVKGIRRMIKEMVDAKADEGVRSALSLINSISRDFGLDDIERYVDERLEGK